MAALSTSRCPRTRAICCRSCGSILPSLLADGAAPVKDSAEAVADTSNNQKVTPGVLCHGVKNAFDEIVNTFPLASASLSAKKDAPVNVLHI